ncbi:MAG TPA: diacylglycerol kinase family protein [Actinomycetota bacterium]|nr:diacylglycerol kinase family protein [Actinomycetota bacterium]
MPTARRASAVVALLGPLVLLVAMVAILLRRPLVLLAAVVLVSLGVGTAAYAVTRTGLRRTVAAVVAVLALVAGIVLQVVAVGSLLGLVLVVALIVVGGLATRYALGRDLASLKQSPTPGVPVGPAAHPVLLMNPKSGGGKVDRFHLVEEATRRGIEPIVLEPGDDLVQLAEQAVAAGADVVGMAGGDGSQALVASVAARHQLGFVCVPAGTRNHLAMDLGLDREDVVGALDGFGEAVERRIDLGLAGEQVFVNNATMGLYAKIVQSPAYRDRKVGTSLELLPDMLGPNATPFDLRFTDPDGTEHASAHLILVSNDRYDLGRGEGFGSRRRIDAGTLGIVAATFRSSGEIARMVQSEAAGRAWRPPGWIEWAAADFQLHSTQPVEVGIDGEALLLDPPIVFRTLPRALRVRIPRSAPGYSPAAAASPKGWSAVTALLQVAAGRPVALGS